MVFRLFRRRGRDRLDHVEALLQRMLADDRHSFDVAAAALLAGAPVEIVGPDLRVTDHRVNQTEQEVRRELIVHASVHGAIDSPVILVYMSIVKDLERIGDYAKNIYDLAAGGVDLSHADDRDELVAVRDEVASLISDTATALAARDGARARALIAAGDRMLDRCDAVVAGFVGSDAPARHAVPRALLYRYVKRIVAHLMNVLSAVVMPVDRLDYFDEDVDDRA